MDTELMAKDDNKKPSYFPIPKRAKNCGPKNKKPTMTATTEKNKKARDKARNFMLNNLCPQT